MRDILCIRNVPFLHVLFCELLVKRIKTIIDITEIEWEGTKVVAFIVEAIVLWLVGVFGWAQIVGSLQNIKVRKSLLFTLLLWVGIMGAAAFVAFRIRNNPWPIVIGYGVSLLQILFSGRMM